MYVNRSQVLYIIRFQNHLGFEELSSQALFYHRYEAAPLPTSCLAVTTLLCLGTWYSSVPVSYRQIAITEKVLLFCTFFLLLCVCQTLILSAFY